MQAMHGALFDTCAFVYWHGDYEKFQSALFKAMDMIRKEKLPLLLSVVSVQEILSWAAAKGASELRTTEAFIRDNFNVLDYFDKAARSAAFFQAETSIPKIKPKSEMRISVDVWFRDAALAGTAIDYQIPLIVTGDRKFADSVRKYKSYLGRVELLEETVTVSIPVPPQLSPDEVLVTPPGLDRTFVPLIEGEPEPLLLAGAALCLPDGEHEPPVDGVGIHLTDSAREPVEENGELDKDMSIPPA